MEGNLKPSPIGRSRFVAKAMKRRRPAGRKNSGNTEVLLVIVLFVAIIFITGVYAWQEIKTADSTNKLLALVQKYAATEKKSEYMVDWNTYTNNNWGFSFSYPKDWAITKDNMPSTVRESLPDEVLLISQKNGPALRTAITIWAKPEGFGIGASRKTFTIRKTNSAGYQVIKEATFDGNRNGEIGYGPTYSIETVQENNQVFPDLFMRFSSVTAGSSDPEFDKLVKEILASFKFTNQTANSGWQIYEDKTNGFSFSYPSGWKFNGSDLFSGTGGYFRVSVVNNTKNLDARGIKDDYYKNDSYGYKYQDSFVKMGGADAYKQARYDLGIIERYYIPYKGKIYGLEFEFNFTDPSLVTKYHGFIEGIIADFKFMDQFSCTQDSDCVAIANPNNGCYKAYFNKNAAAAIAEYKKSTTGVPEDCPKYGPAICKNNTCQAEFVKSGMY